MTVPGEVTFKVKQFIAARERFTTDQVAKLTGLNRKSVETVVQRLVQDGYVAKSRETAPGTGRGRRPLYYTLTADMKKRKELVNEVNAFQPQVVPVRVRPLSANYMGAHEMLDELEREPDAPEREARLAKIEKHLELAAFEERLEDGEEGTAVVRAYLLRERARVVALRHQWVEAERSLGEAHRVFEEHGLGEEVEKTDQYRFALLIRQRLAVAKDDEEIGQICREIPHIVQEMGLSANPVVQLAAEMSKLLSIPCLSQPQLERDWQAVQDVFEAGEYFEATVGDYNEGDITVRLGKVRGLVPVTPSERAPMRELRGRQKEKLSDELQKRDVRRGRVSSFVLSRPVFAYIELTSQRTNRSQDSGNVFVRPASPSLSAAQWREVLLKLAPHVLRLRLTGGEPTLHSEFEAIVEFVQELDIPFALFTSACWRDPDRIIRLLRDSTCFAGLLISLHGPDPESHDAFTDVPGSFEETCANVRRAVAAGLTVSTSTILTRLNCDRVAEVVRLSQELGAAQAVFNRYVTARADHLIPTDDQLIAAIRHVDAQRDAGAAVRFSVCIPQCFYPSSSTGCLAGIAYCTVDPWGNVRPCNHAPLICGNLLEQSIEEIWHGSEMQHWREMLSPQCHDCLEFPKCHGGCRAAAMLYGLEKDPLIGEAILEKAQQPFEELVLHERVYPTGHFAIRPEPFGYVLVRGNRVIPVAHQAKPVLDVLDGRFTLRQIKERLGQKALDFVGSLYKKGFVELR